MSGLCAAVGFAIGGGLCVACGFPFSLGYADTGGLIGGIIGGFIFNQIVLEYLRPFYAEFIKNDLPKHTA